MNERGQSQFLSIGILFSIILIIAIVGISIYVITKFVNIGDCANVEVFKDDFQRSMNRAWSSEIVRDTYVGSLPSGIEAICLGEGTGSGIKYGELKDYQRWGNNNLFFYPPKESCDDVATEIEHIEFDFSWHCFDVVNREVRIPYEKGSFDDLVKITRTPESDEAENG